MVDAHDQFAYTIKLTNTSRRTQRSRQISDPLPTQVTFKSVVVSRADFSCTTNGNTRDVLVTPRQPLAARESVTVTINVQDNVDGLDELQEHGRRVDAPTNKATDTATVIVAGTDLAVTKTGPAQAQVGDAVAYTITVTNKGQYPARGAQLTDALPSQLANVSAPGCTIAASPALVLARRRGARRHADVPDRRHRGGDRHRDGQGHRGDAHERHRPLERPGRP